MAQDLTMQIERLEKVVDSLYNSAQSSLGEKHRITKQALKAFLFFQGLKADVAASVVEREKVE